MCDWWLSKVELARAFTECVIQKHRNDKTIGLWQESYGQQGSVCRFPEWGDQGVLKFPVWPSYQPCEVIRVSNIIPVSPWGNSPKQVESYPGLQNQPLAEPELESKIFGLSSSACCLHVPCSSWLVITETFWEWHCYKSAALLKPERLKTQYCESFLVSVVRCIFSILLFLDC